MKRILIADDHAVIRNGVKQILSKEFLEIEFGEASNASEVIKIIKERSWDALILDMNMPGRNGLEILRQLRDEGIKVPVLMFSMHPEEQVAIRALKSGA